MIKQRDRDIINFLDNGAKAISIRQASALFFNNSYETARYRLSILESKYNLLKNYTMKETGEKIYYISKKISYHDSLVISFISYVKSIGGEFIYNKFRPNYMNRKIQADLFSIFKLKGFKYYIILEVDLYHSTPLSKMKIYEELYKSNEIQSQNNGQFPIIIISKALYNTGLKYNSKNFNTIYTDKSFNNVDKFLECL